MNLKETLKTILSPIDSEVFEELASGWNDAPNRGGVCHHEYIDLIQEEFPFVSFPFNGNMKNVFTFSSSDRKLGLDVLHFGGSFYLLDPSSALVPNFLPTSNCYEIVLDMCSAPGGKTITYALNNPHSLIIANDISHNRSVELAHNIERLGLSNVIVTCFDPQKLELPEHFDKIILDAPCSGSGMFIKEPKMAEDWSMDKVQRCLLIQQQLFDKAYDLLKPGGYLAYSTCSFSKEEDDDIISRGLTVHPDLKAVEIDDNYNLYKTRYGHLVLPTRFKGEGQYFSIIKKKVYPPLLLLKIIRMVKCYLMNVLIKTINME